MSIAGGEAALSVFLEFFAKLASYDQILNFVTEKQVIKQLKEWQKILPSLQAVLNDAEEKQMKDPNVKIWLTKLQNLGYDAGDALDEFAVEALHRKSHENEANSSKAQKPIASLFSSLMNSRASTFNKKMISKLEEIGDELNGLAREKARLGLREIDETAMANRIKSSLQFTSLVGETETHVYGREKEKAEILELILGNNRNENEALMIHIFGVGGIGKTALARLVYSNDNVKKSFDHRFWICVSKDFDVTLATKNILQSVANVCCIVPTLDNLQALLKDKLFGKSLLLVLDNVRNENYDGMAVLLKPFGVGTKVILTTRSSNVSPVVGSARAYLLQKLSHEDCLSVLTHHALKASDFSGHQELEKVGENIVNKCNGLPLAAKVIGCLLGTHVEYGVWKDVSDSEIWDLPEERCGVVPALGAKMKSMPLRIGKLTNLRRLSDFILAAGDGCRIRELKNLHLKGDLCISGLENIVETQDAFEAKLIDKPGLDALRLMWSTIFECVSNLPLLYDIEIDGCKELVLRDVADFPPLRKVSLSNISKFSPLTERLVSGISNLDHLSISCCNDLASLPWKQFGSALDLRSLRSLEMSSFTQLEFEEQQLQLEKVSNIESLTIGNFEKLHRLPQDLHVLTFLTEMQIKGCRCIVSFSMNNLPPALKRLVIKDCTSLRCLVDQVENTSISNTCSLEHLEIMNCPLLASLSLPIRLQVLNVANCSRLASLSSSGELPSGIKQLLVKNCLGLESIAQAIHETSSLELLEICRCGNLKSLPQGLNKLNRVEKINILLCQSLVSLTASGLPTRKLESLWISDCQSLADLPNMQKLTALKKLSLFDCSPDLPFPEEGLPTNLTSLSVTVPKLCHSLLKWGLHKLTSLKELFIDGRECPHVVTFPPEGCVLPPTLTSITVINFGNLKSLSTTGCRNVNSLRELWLLDCPEIESLPEKDVLLPLWKLYIRRCHISLLGQLILNQGPEWLKISHIPEVIVDRQSIIPKATWDQP
ncbi:hypothetical protein V6N11_038416 [Hibiscus sabdariffa]|uniref:Uncharacterized protein n=1 Tax=Hibiscus sabdariffa TaxID=183260 RepID=A0ABR2SKU6_9ROSI